MRIRALAIAGLLAVLSTVAGSIAFASEPRVRPRTWAKRVCTTARPATERAAARFAAADSLTPGPVLDVEEMVQRVETSDELVAGMADALAGLREGVATAGIPKIANGRDAARKVRRDLDVLLEGLRDMRRVFAEFLKDPASDPEAAARRVQDAFEEHLSPEAFGDLADHWPRRLTGAMRKVPECVLLGQVLEDAAAAF